MATQGSNTAQNGSNADSSNGGGRVREYAERTKEKAPPEAVGTFQSSFISMFTGKPCGLQYGNEWIRQAHQPFGGRSEPNKPVAATLQTHPKVQMHPLLQRNSYSANNSQNSLLTMLAKKHNEAVQRALEEEETETENSVELEKGQIASSGEETIQQGGAALMKSQEQEEGVRRNSAESEGSAASNTDQPEVQRNISPTGEADKDVQTQPQGPHRTRADPAGPVRVQSSSSEFGAVQMDGEEIISQKSDTEEAPGNTVSPKNKYVQAAGQQQSGTPALESDLKSSKGAGTPMANADRGFFESRMGADFSNVRIHTGSQAVQMNEGLGAKAFAHGSDIYFNANQYQPGTSSGKHLLAHELTHTVQQGGSSVRKSVEREAESDSPERLGEVQASPSVGQRLRLNRSVQASEAEADEPTVQTQCESCAKEEPTVSRNNSENIAPKVQSRNQLGSAALTQLIAPNSSSVLNLQPQLKIGQVGDKYEQEADATADKVMRMTDDKVSPSRANPATKSPTIQRFSLSGAWNWAKGKVKQGANWVKGTLGKVGDWALDKLAAMLENVPGWHLLTVLLGKNPITGEAVPRTDRNLVEGMVKLAPMGQLTFQALDARGGIDRAAQWLTKHRAKYLLTNQDILKLTDKALGYAKDWKMGEAMAVIKIGLGRLFQLGSAALIKFIEIAIEKVLDFTIWLVEQISPAAFMPLTPLVFVFKHGMIGFLTRLRGQGGAKLLQMLLNIGKAITSPGFIGAYLKGIIKGFFVDGLWGTITFLWEIVKLPFTIAVFIAKLAAYLSSPEWIKKVVAITKAIQETGTWLKENGTSMIQDLQKEAGGGGGIQLGAIFNSLVSSAAGWVQKGGEKMADQMIAFFSQSPDKLGPALGNTVGTVVGMVLFEVVLSAVTFGGGSAVTATKTALRPIFNLLGKVGAGALKAITTIAAKLRKWISGAAKALLSYISKISRKIGSKVEGLFGNLRKWVDELELGGKKESSLKRNASGLPESQLPKGNTRHAGKNSDLGKYGNKKIKSEIHYPDGHKVKALEDGQCLVCSKCKPIRGRFEDELNANPEIKDRLRKLEDQLEHAPDSDRTKLMEQQKAIHDELVDLQTPELAKVIKSFDLKIKNRTMTKLDWQEYNRASRKFEYNFGNISNRYKTINQGGRIPDSQIKNHLLEGSKYNSELNYFERIESPSKSKSSHLGSEIANSSVLHEEPLIYSPSRKHLESGWGTTMDLSDELAGQVLSSSEKLGKQRYGFNNGKIYEFQPDNVGGWHGYPISPSELVNQKGGVDILRKWHQNGLLSSSDYKKLIKNQ